MKINNLRDMIHINAKEHGWWDEERTFGEIIALCHSELSEALEEYRKGNGTTEIYYHGEYCPGADVATIKQKPEGIPIELADCIIRILDFCGKEGIDIESAIKIKHDYNKTRPYKHGGKRI